MKRRQIYLFGGLSFFILFTWLLSNSDNQQEELSEIVKISLRDVGNQLLHSNQDATSLVLPVIELEKLKYQLSFQNELAITPDSLVSIIKRSFEKSTLPKNYRVEVIQCADQEVAYSYDVKNKEEKSIIPCSGRFLPESCYTIKVRFTNVKKPFFYSNQNLLYGIIIGIFLLIQFIIYKRKLSETAEKKRIENSPYASIGSFHFYPEQNKLVKKAKEISLSKKECELLAIFIANPNQIIKRDELMKRVWEDHGVVVGRSLDTYISKLRKILKEDDTIKITNVHGVGYKLEVLV